MALDDVTCETAMVESFKNPLRSLWRRVMELEMKHKATSSDIKESVPSVGKALEQSGEKDFLLSSPFHAAMSAKKKATLMKEMKFQ
jgi:hypothetical protein